MALLLVGILHVVPDSDDPQAYVRTLVDALAPGSLVVISHMTDSVDVDDADMATVVGRRLDERMHTSNPPAFRSRDEVRRFLDGLELVEPGLVTVPEWRPDEGRDRSPDPPRWSRRGPKRVGGRRGRSGRPPPGCPGGP